MIIFELFEQNKLLTNGNISWSDELTGIEKETCLRALHSIDERLNAKGLGWLMNKTRFDFKIVSGRGAFFHKNIITIDPTKYSEQDIEKSLAHELGHKLMSDSSFFKKFKIFWYHYDNQIDLHVTNYARSNHFEMFAELFRYYLYDLLTPEQEQWITRFLNNSNTVKEATAYHGSNHHFEEFDAAYIGTGTGAHTFGWGIYLSSQKSIAKNYKTKRSGAVYMVDMPEPSEMLDWEKPFSQQSPQVQQALLKIDYPAIRQRMVDEDMVSGYDDSYTNDSGEDIYGIIATSVMSPIGTPWTKEGHMEDKKKTSMVLYNAGIMGTKYFDVEADDPHLENYVIFDPRRVQIKKKVK